MRCVVVGNEMGVMSGRDVTIRVNVSDDDGY